MSSLDRSLTNITPSPEKIQDIESLRDAAKTFANVLESLTPVSREQSLAKTHLEETLMWAAKSIVLS